MLSARSNTTNPSPRPPPPRVNKQPANTWQNPTDKAEINQGSLSQPHCAQGPPAVLLYYILRCLSTLRCADPGTYAAHQGDDALPQEAPCAIKSWPIEPMVLVS